jgi:hypothetical protein
MKQNTMKTPKQMVEAIFALDLDPIKLKLMDKEEGQGWTSAQADHYETEYRRFLALLATYPDEVIAPNTNVDKFWHGHILDTMKYAEDCNEIFGYFLHHFPYFGMRGEEDEANLAAAAANMKRLYEEEFGPAVAAGKAAYCGEIRPAYCGEIRPEAAVAAQERTAYCGEIKPAYCGEIRPERAVAAQERTAYCGEIKPAYCGEIRPEAAVAAQERTAYCGEIKPAYCGEIRPAAAAARQERTAYCGEIKPAYCGEIRPEQAALKRNVVAGKGRPKLDPVPA